MEENPGSVLHAVPSRFIGEFCKACFRPLAGLQGSACSLWATKVAGKEQSQFMKEYGGIGLLIFVYIISWCLPHSYAERTGICRHTCTYICVDLCLAAGEIYFVIDQLVIFFCKPNETLFPCFSLTLQQTPNQPYFLYLCPPPHPHPIHPSWFPPITFISGLDPFESIMNRIWSPSFSQH